MTLTVSTLSESSPLKPPSFVHLRVHSEYSLGSSIVRIDPLIESTVAQSMPAVAVTDSNNLFALIKFYSAAQAAGVKPVLAADVLVVPRTENGPPTPLVLFARNEVGYRNLSQLISRAYTEGQNTRHAMLQPDWIEERANGLLALSGGQEGDVGQALSNGRVKDAENYTHEWMRIFPEAFYLELQRTGRAGEEDYIQQALDIAQQLDCPVVATNDVRFIRPDEFEAHEVRVCIHDGRTLDDPRRERRYSAEQYFKSPEEMAALFNDIPEAIENTVEIARRCSVKVGLGHYSLPNYHVPESYTPETLLFEIAGKGLTERFARMDQEALARPFSEYRERLEYELEVIKKTGFAGYYLIVMEFIQWAREHDIPVGPGRGSGVGSLVAYALRITDIDPLEFDLLFERFLTPDRISPPDFDIDFCINGRDQVIHHVMERYGREAVSQIITFGTMAAKAVVRDVARVQGKPYNLADKLSKLIPLEPGMPLARPMDEEPLLKEFVAHDEDADEIMEMAYKLEGIARNIGKHAGGVVIAPTQLTDFSPVFCDAAGDGMMTQFDMIDCEKVGLVKFDFLGLRTLTIIDHAVKSINDRLLANGQSPVDIASIPLDDAAIYRDLKQAKTTAVFQLESRGMKDLIKKVKPDRFSDVVALVALYRPGPMQLADDFVKRKQGEIPVDYLHPKLEKVLEDTYGVMLYQEQVMQIAQVLAGYTLADADILRKAMGKKQPEEMAKQRQVFLEGAVSKGVDEKQAEHIFSLMEKFAGYGFNKPHSVAYALIAFQTAWLKHHYPSDFMAAVLSEDMQNTDKLVIRVDECQEMGLNLIPPDINRGEFRFKTDDEGNIIYGLGAVKGLGEGHVSAMVTAREQDGEFKDLYEFCERVGSRLVNRRTVDALTGSGALDSLVTSDLAPDDAIDYKRALLYVNQEDAVKMAEQKARNIDSGIGDLFGEDMMLSQGEHGRYSHFDSLQRLTLKDRLAREKLTLGLYLTAHPIDMYRKELKHLARTRIAELRAGAANQMIAGSILAVRRTQSRRGGSMAFLTLEDRSGRIDVGISAEMYELHREHLQKDDVIVVKGKVRADDYNGGVRLRSDELFSIAQARARSARKLMLNVDHSNLPPDFVTELADMLTPYRGNGCPVAVGYRRPDAMAEVVLGDEWRVLPEDDLLQNLRDRYGSEQVNLQY